MSVKVVGINAIQTVNGVYAINAVNAVYAVNAVNTVMVVKAAEGANAVYVVIVKAAVSGKAV
jgi:hypothetical protein